MAGLLVGKVALVTGGLSGIGPAVVARFASEGAQVIAADINADSREIADASIASTWLDVAEPQSCADLIDAIRTRHGRLDILVNSAGIGADLPFLDTSVDVFDRVYAVNLRALSWLGRQRRA